MRRRIFGMPPVLFQVRQIRVVEQKNEANDNSTGYVVGKVLEYSDKV